jgi:ABC-type bacteriocin/lantibiotic exporter with double-glycine peptidase domain
VWRRYAFVRQNDQSDCGAAALATIALHHRRPIGLQQMRELAGTDRIGTNGVPISTEKKTTNLVWDLSSTAFCLLETHLRGGESRNRI